MVGSAVGLRFVNPIDFGLPRWSRLACLGVVVVAYIVLALCTYEDDPK
jgi:hypothetical protein